jgi:hypothetical protein
LDVLVEAGRISQAQQAEALAYLRG